MVSSRHEDNREQVKIIRVMEFPERDYWSTRVSLESRKGMWSWPRERALMVLPRHDRDRLILIAY